MTLNEFNLLSKVVQSEKLFHCCGCALWVEKLLRQSPYESINELKLHSDLIWFSLEPNHWLEAFTHHPKIGDIKSLEEKFSATKQWAAGEQAGVITTSHDTLLNLKNGNDEYEKKFGFIFIVCATGKSAMEMLHMLTQRLKNDVETEIKIAAEEQNKITHIRIDKLFV